MLSIVTVAFVDQNAHRQRQPAQRHGVHASGRKPPASTIAARIDSGIDMAMMMVERHEPRNSRIIKRGQRRRNHALADNAGYRRLHEHRLVADRQHLQ